MRLRLLLACDTSVGASVSRPTRIVIPAGKYSPSYLPHSFPSYKLISLPSRVVDEGSKLRERNRNVKDWVVTFCKQLFVGVTREEWQVGRCSFFLTHRLHAEFDFHQYLIECFEEEVAVVSRDGWPSVSFTVRLAVVGFSVFSGC